MKKNIQTGDPATQTMGHHSRRLPKPPAGYLYLKVKNSAFVMIRILFAVVKIISTKCNFQIYFLKR